VHRSTGVLQLLPLLETAQLLQDFPKRMPVPTAAQHAWSQRSNHGTDRDACRSIRRAGRPHACVSRQALSGEALCRQSYAVDVAMPSSPPACTAAALALTCWLPPFLQDGCTRGWGLCLTSAGSLVRTYGAYYTDLPSNMLGSFIMGCLATSSALGLAVDKVW
jgi:hypothetical protein